MALAMAEVESVADRKVFVVVSLNETIFYSCRDCWKKDGAMGSVLITIYPPQYSDNEVI